VVKVRVGLRSIERLKLVLAYRVVKQADDGEALVAEAAITLVCIDVSKGNRPTRIPEALREALGLAGARLAAAPAVSLRSFAGAVISASSTCLAVRGKCVQRTPSGLGRRRWSPAAPHHRGRGVKREGRLILVRQAQLHVWVRGGNGRW